MADFNDTILQKIWRDFPESEALAFCKMRISDLRVEVGVLTSDLAEMRDKAIGLEIELIAAQKALEPQRNLDNIKNGYKGNILGLERERDKLQQALFEANLKIKSLQKKPWMGK